MICSINFNAYNYIDRENFLSVNTELRKCEDEEKWQ